MAVNEDGRHRGYESRRQRTGQPNGADRQRTTVAERKDPDDDRHRPLGGPRESE
jgi:hypothetical protein